MKKFRRFVAVFCAALLAVSSFAGNITVNASEPETDVNPYVIVTTDTFEEESSDVIDLFEDGVENGIDGQNEDLENESDEQNADFESNFKEQNEDVKIDASEEGAEIEAETGDKSLDETEVYEAVSDGEIEDTDVIENESEGIIEDTESNEIIKEAAEELISDDVVDTDDDEVITEETEASESEEIAKEEEVLAIEDTTGKADNSFTVTFFKYEIDGRNSAYYSENYGISSLYDEKNIRCTRTGIKKGKTTSLPVNYSDSDNCIEYWYYRDSSNEKVIFTNKTKIYSDMKIFAQYFDAQDVMFGIVLDSENMYYTGKPLTPKTRIEMRGEDYPLTEGVDYTVSFKNNINVYRGDDKSKATKAIVKLKGYSDTIEAYFSIRPRDIEELGIPTKMVLDYTGEKLEPFKNLKFNDYSLVLGKDYEVTYTDEEGNHPDEIIEIGKYTVKIKGVGNFDNEVSINLTVPEPDKSLSKAKILGVSDYTYKIDEDEDREVVFKDLSVELNGEVLSKDYYSVKYAENDQAGIATVTVTGKDGYYGSASEDFLIKGYPISDVKVTGLPEEQVWSPSEYAVYPELSCDAHEYKLEYGRDYYCTFEVINNKKVEITIFGRGFFEGSVKKTYKLKPWELSRQYIVAVAKKTEYYVKNGNKTFNHDIKVMSCPTCHGNYVLLTEGKDYKILGLKNNKKATSFPDDTSFVKVKFKGLYSGTIEIPYAIERTPLDKLVARGGTVSVPGVKYVNKNENFLTTPVIKDVNGAKLKKNTDFCVEYYADDECKEMLTARKCVEAGSVVYAKIYGLGNYSGSIVCPYRVSKKNIAKAKVTVPSRKCCGKAITFTPEEIKVKLNGKVLTSDDYEIVEDSYRNNIKYGKGSFQIRAKGEEFYGTKTVSFKIKKATIKNYKVFIW